MSKKHFGMIKSIFVEEVESPCQDVICTRVVKSGQEYFMDILSGDPVTYCYDCGLCLRYARKKASQRGESIINATVD